MLRILLLPPLAQPGMSLFLNHETHLPAEQDQAQADPRLPRPHGDQERPPRHQAPPRQGPQAPVLRHQPLTLAPASPRLGFSPGHKLRTGKDFERVRRCGRRAADDLFGLQYAENDVGHARLGMAVSLRTAGSAVRRNRIRRLIRESFRLNQARLPPADIVVNARAATRAAKAQELTDSLAKLWDRIGRS